MFGFNRTVSGLLLTLWINAIGSLSAPVNLGNIAACDVCGTSISTGFKATIYSYASSTPDFNALIDFSKIGSPWHVTDSLINPNYNYRDGQNWVYVPWFQPRLSGDYLYDAFIFGGNDYRVEYTGWFQPPKDGLYQFIISFDQGAGAAISLGGGSNCFDYDFKSIVTQQREWSVESNNPVTVAATLKAGKNYPLEISYIKAATPASPRFSIQYLDPDFQLHTTFENVFNFDQTYCPSPYKPSYVA